VQFRRHGATVMGAAKQTRENEFMFAVSGLVTSGKHSLYAIKSVGIDQWLVGTFVLNALPNEISKIEAVLQDRCQIRLGQIGPSFTELQGFPQCGEGVVAACCSGAMADGAMLKITPHPSSLGNAEQFESPPATVVPYKTPLSIAKFPRASKPSEPP
jgi:hypothetical protein